MPATSPRQLWPLPNVIAAIGFKSSAVYEQINAGLLPLPISVGPRAKRFLSDEVQAVVDARAAGADDAAIRVLVKKMAAARTARTAVSD